LPEGWEDGEVDIIDEGEWEIQAIHSYGMHKSWG